MDQQVTISVKGMAVAGVVLLALAAAFLIGRGGTAAEAAPAATPATTAGATAEADTRTLTMRGEGEASVVPDQAAFDVSVRVVRDDLETALDDSGAMLERVLGRLGALGIPRGDVETTGLEMSPVYDYSSTAPPVLRGYRVSQSVAVLVKELARTGRAITAAVEEGGNAVRVGDIQLRVGDPEAALARARADAVEAATTKAEEYAAATGQQLGEVMTLFEVQPEQVSSVIEQRSLYAFADAARASLPIRSGRSELGVTVQVVWTLGAGG